ncbi:DUF4125 family protein [uncultured Bifidobacterium sp.]|uniref:DUF4125 family protein n=1 Tax=uncultured Bifidobacterium sp. TaxID=165187 RepID=UPI00262A2C14|nr:DUF4125 family protein [uncultured Bifidobacterium sp.]
MVTQESVKPATAHDPSIEPLVTSVVTHEWRQFQNTSNEGGRASCQNNWPMFFQMRTSQFLTWPHDLLSSYEDDLERAEHVGRNLVTEKYARMMESTDPVAFDRDIRGFIPPLGESRVELQERIIAVQVRWAGDFRGQYPHLGAAMRVLRTAQDTIDDTSFETYLRGELGTYSDRTLSLYARFIEDIETRRGNLTRDTIENTVKLAGFSDLDEAEMAQKDSA